MLSHRVLAATSIQKTVQYTAFRYVTNASKDVMAAAHILAKIPWVPFSFSPEITGDDQNSPLLMIPTWEYERVGAEFVTKNNDNVPDPSVVVQQNLDFLVRERARLVSKPNYEKDGDLGTATLLLHFYGDGTHVFHERQVEQTGLDEATSQQYSRVNLCLCPVPQNWVPHNPENLAVEADGGMLGAIETVGQAVGLCPAIDPAELETFRQLYPVGS